jgi:hypothetical protein
MFCISDGCRGSGGCIVIAWSVGVSLPRRLGMIYLERWVETVSLYSVRSRSIVFGYNLQDPKNRFESFIRALLPTQTASREALWVGRKARILVRNDHSNLVGNISTSAPNKISGRYCEEC